jgi:hypothetical protein
MFVIDIIATFPIIVLDAFFSFAVRTRVEVYYPLSIFDFLITKFTKQSIRIWSAHRTLLFVLRLVATYANFELSSYVHEEDTWDLPNKLFLSFLYLARIRLHLLGKCIRTSVTFLNLDAIVGQSLLGTNEFPRALAILDI